MSGRTLLGRLRSGAVAVLAAAVPRRSGRAGLVAGRLVGAILSLPLGSDARRVLQARRAVQFLAASGGGPFTNSFVSGLGRSPSPALREAVHGVLVELHSFDEAEQVADELELRGEIDTDRSLVLAAERALADGRAGVADRHLGSLDDGRTTGATAVQRVVATRLGQPERVLELLDRPNDLAPAELAVARFDALWLLGDLAAATEQITRLEPEQLIGRIEPLRRWRNARQAAGVSPTDLFAELLDAGVAGPATPPDWQTTVRFELGDLAGLHDDVRRCDLLDRLGPTGRYDLARTHYVERHFDAARSLLPSLVGTFRHWDGEKLGHRILLEEGSYEAAWSGRRSRSRLRPVFDEVQYFAGLHLRRYEESFTSYLPVDDLARLRAEHPDRAETRPREHRRSRMVITQNGPGDEVLVASTLHLLRDRTDHLAVTCDPRLETLLSRSFPDIDFVACDRLASRPQLGFLAEHTDRRGHAFFDLLDAPGRLAADASDAVLLGRSLTPLSVDGPFPSYLAPDAHRCTEVRAMLDRPVLGLVWRSEFVDPMRGIHYLTVDELAPLAELDVDWVCLQHDVTAEEGARLRAMFGNRLTFTDLDLRDDFETMAALVAECQGVVGVGTTIVELAAAVGTPTITMYPSRIGAWRRLDDSVADHWHETMVTAVISDHGDRVGCVREAASMISRWEWPARPNPTR